MRLSAVAVATVALLAVTAFEPTARADEPSNNPQMKAPVEGRHALDVTGHALLIGGGLALAPAAYVGGTVAIGAFEPGGAERASKDFQEPVVFVPLAVGFVAIMVGAALLVTVNPPTDTPSRAKQSASAFRTPFAFTF